MTKLPPTSHQQKLNLERVKKTKKTFIVILATAWRHSYSEAKTCLRGYPANPPDTLFMPSKVEKQTMDRKV